MNCFEMRPKLDKQTTLITLENKRAQTTNGRQRVVSQQGCTS